ncbi:hypothetical protein AWE89_23925 [Escherichia coli]|nr:hypothetical protein AWE89_23925 [Escherichia coli]
MYDLWSEQTYLWHRVKPNLTVHSVPEADVICIVLYLFMGGTSVEMLMAEGFINGGLSILDIKLDMDIKGIKYGQFHQ